MFIDRIQISYDAMDHYAAPYALILELNGQNTMLNQQVLRFDSYIKFIQFIHSFRKQLTDVENNLLGELKHGAT